MGLSALLACAVICSLGALLMVTLAFSTDHWLEYTFARGNVKTAIQDGSLALSVNTSLWSDPLFYTRHRGLFRTCFPGSDTYFLDSRDDVIEGQCLLEEGYEILRPLESTARYPMEYQTRKHLMRAHVGMFIAAVLMLLVSCLTGAIGCWKASKQTLMAAGITLFVGAFFTAGGMAVFHGYEYLENEAINLPLYPKGWSTTITRYTNVQYGWSYIVGWLGMAIAVVGAMIYFTAAYTAAAEKYEDKHPVDYDHKATRYLEQSPYYPSNYGPQPYHMYPRDHCADYGGYRY